ncbi:MAG: hypothetical protein EOM24_09545, partial [Chloroflexia bacterium]|nr:hypothetical protein [Chloroflexia bacterium]
MRVLGTRNISATDSWITLDFLDTWDGTDLDEGLFAASSARIYRSNDWQVVPSDRMPGGGFIERGTNAWFHIIGDALTLVGVTNSADQSGPTLVEVFVDEVSRGMVDLTYAFSRSPVPIRLTGLGEGLHVVRLANLRRGGLAGFDTSATPFAGIPMVEWYVQPGGGSTTTPAVGDLDGDGTVEIVITTQQGVLAVYRGDGQPGPDGSTPLLWSVDLGTTDRDTGGVESPAIVNLDATPEAEIIVGTDAGLYAFRYDGELLWKNETIRSTAYGAVSVANLDDDGSPEIVAIGNDGLYVLQADGTIIWHYRTSRLPTPPVLADLTGDGWLDILIAADRQLRLFDYQTDPPTLLWSRASPSGSQYGAPAIANLDATPEPEIVMAWDGLVEALDVNGQQLWQYETGGVYPSSISIANLDDDPEPEIVFYMKNGAGMLYALNADGTLRWSVEARDPTRSSSGVSLHDLDGDGRWEVIWNGSTDGLTIYNGGDGSVLFRESVIGSRTIMDYPVIADVDGDGKAEIVTVDPEGIYVVGFAGWGSTRPLWTQYNYHITNANDDLTVPLLEPNSWEVHNTYRTQSPLRNPVPVYLLDVEHPLPATGVVPLTTTFSLPPRTPAPGLTWRYRQEGLAQPVRTLSFAAQLTAMQPGEVRAVSEGTTVTSTLASGRNQLTFPPLYVTAARLVTIDPVQPAARPGSQARYEVEFFNPTTTALTFTLNLDGLPLAWADLPGEVRVEPETRLRLPLTLTPSAATLPGALPFTVRTTLPDGTSDQATSMLDVLAGLRLGVTPPALQAAYGATVSATVTLHNDEATARTYDLAVMGLDGLSVALAASVAVPAGGVATLPLTVTAMAAQQVTPFAVRAILRDPIDPLTTTAQATLVQNGAVSVTAQLAPDEAVGGPATTSVLTLTVTNSGSMAST